MHFPSTKLCPTLKTHDPNVSETDKNWFNNVRLSVEMCRDRYMDGMLSRTHANYETREVNSSRVVGYTRCSRFARVLMHFATQRQLAREEERAAWVNLQLPAQLQKRLWWPIHVRWSEHTQSCKQASISREVASSRDFDSSSLALLTVRATEPGGSSAEKTIGTMPTGVESEAARAGWAGRIRGRGTYVKIKSLGGVYM